MIFNKKDYPNYIGRWVVPTLAWDFCYRWGVGKVLKEFQATTKEGFLILDGHCYFHKENNEVVEKLFRKPTETQYSQFFDKFLSLTEEVFNDFYSLRTNAPVNDPTSSLKEFFKRFDEIVCPWVVSILAGDILEEEILKKAKEQKVEMSQLLERIGNFKKNFSTVAHDEMRQIRDELNKRNLLSASEVEIEKSAPEIYKKIADFVEEYEWLGTHHFWGTPMSVERFLDEVKSLSDSDKVSTINFSSEIEFLLKKASMLAWVRQQAAELSDIVSFAYKHVFNAVAQKLGVSYEDLIWFSHDEIFEGLEGKQIPDISIIKQRQKTWGGYFSPDKVVIFDQPKLEELLTEFVDFKKEASEVKGRVAMKGKVTGKARIVLAPSQTQGFNIGDILIAPETTPDFLPLMKMSAAIVTDRGGITSHAAIVSRELRKPCIIGTEHATHVFKDGDMVEVDAEKGIVKLLK